MYILAPENHLCHGPWVEVSFGTQDHPRLSLAKWMTSRENPYFARTMANRLWAHFLGRGLVHPIDDARSTNPPSNPELLDSRLRRTLLPAALT